MTSGIGSILHTLSQPCETERRCVQSNGEERWSQEYRDYAIKTWLYLRLAMVLLVVGLAVAIGFERTKVDCFQPSISAYYYTPVRNFFVGAVIGIAVCLLCLRGNDPIEDVLLNLAGMLAPVVALVPTPDHGGCTSLAQALTQDQSPNIANNGFALLAVGLVGVVIAVVVTEKKGPTLYARIGYQIAAVLWIAATLVFWLDRSGFVHGAHYAAAIPMFACIALVVLSNACAIGASRDPRSLRNRYGVIVGLMGASAVACAVAGIAGWRSWLIALESALLLLFSVFWLLQTFEQRDSGLREQGPDPRRGALVTELPKHIPLLRRRIGTGSPPA